MSSSARDRLPPMYVAGAVAVAVVFIGFIGGTRDPGTPLEPPAPSTGTPRREGSVPAYRDLAAMSHNAPHYRLGGLTALTEAVERSGDIEELRRQRASRRAYDGAPPTIPHSVPNQERPTCLVCHEHGARIGDKIAPAMSHRPYESCTQCHVPQSSPLQTAPPAPLTTNSFTGLASPGPGSRAWAGAPPMIPHRTWMRQRCDSCHGASGANPIRTTHPWRQSCRQCHVPDASAAQAPPRIDRPAGPWGSAAVPGGSR